MEAILHSVLLRRERVELQHEAEFEQQGQLLFTYTESLFDILPIQPSNKRPRMAYGLNFGQVPSCYDKENLVRPRKYSNEYATKWQGTKEPHSRALADKDPNINVYDSSFKNLACMATAKACSRRQVATLSVADCPQCWNCQAPLRNADPERGVNLNTKYSVEVPMKTEADEQAGKERHVSAPQNGTHCMGNSNKKRSRNEGDGAIYVYEDKIHENFQESGTDVEEMAKKAMAKSLDEKSYQSMTKKEVTDVGVVEENQEGNLRRPVPRQLTAAPGRRGRHKHSPEPEIRGKERAEKATVESVDERGIQCITRKGVSDAGVVEEEREGGSRLPALKNKTAEPGKRGRPKRAAAASAATAQMSQRVTRAQTRKHEVPRCETTSEPMSTSQPRTKSTAREEKKLSSVLAPGVEEPGVQLADCNIKPTTGTLTLAETSGDRRNQSLQGQFDDTEELEITEPCMQVLNAVCKVKETTSVITRVDHDDKDCERYFMESKSFEMRDKFHTGGATVLTEQDMYPDVTLTLDRWEYRKRLSPRSKARARRWKSDVALKGEDHGQGHAANEPTTSPDRATLLEDNSIEVFACETILQTPVAEMHKLATLGLSTGGGEATNRNSFLPQYPEKVNSMPLLQSIYELRNACKNGMSSASEFLEEGEQRQVESLIASADRIVQHLSGKRAFPVRAVVKTLTPITSTLNIPKSSDLCPSEAYPENFTLLTSTCSLGEVQDNHPAYHVVPSFSQLASLTGSPAVAAPLLPEKNISTSTKHANVVRLAESMVPASDFAFSEFVNEAASGASPGHFRSVCSGQIPRASDACKLDLSQKGASASRSPPAMITIIQSSSSTVADHLNPASDVVKLALINSTSSTTVFQTQPSIKSGNSVVAIGNNGSKFVHPDPPGGMGVQGDIGVQSYEISPFRDSSDEDSEDEQERSQKPIPQWARKEHLLGELERQVHQDPDEIFSSASSCTLDEVFRTKGSKRRPDFRRRGSSGDWDNDCVTWQEVVHYKNSMGYLH